jgi:hypothetical protein
MIKLRAIVDTVARSGVPVLHKLVEKGVDIVAVRGTGESRELASNADTAMEHHGGQKARLAVRETESGDGLNAFVGGQSRSSSARCGSGDLPPWLPLRPPMRALDPRYDENPERPTAAPWAPR